MWVIETLLQKAPCSAVAILSFQQSMSSLISPIMIPIIHNQPGFVLKSHGRMMDYPQARNG